MFLGQVILGYVSDVARPKNSKIPLQITIFTNRYPKMCVRHDAKGCRYLQETPVAQWRCRYYETVGVGLSLLRHYPLIILAILAIPWNLAPDYSSLNSNNS